MDGELQAALLGALVGGLASGLATLVGSVLVNRWQLKKSMRLRIYDQLIPKIRDERAYYSLARAAKESEGKPPDPPPPSQEFVDRIFEVVRAGTIIGGKTAKLTKEIHRNMARQVVYTMGDKGFEPIWVPAPEQVEKLDKRLDILVHELSKRLAKKLD